MITLSILIQMLIGLGLLNVWLLRFNNYTDYRGGGAKNMKQEFAVYGLPEWSVYMVGFLKVSIALLLLVGIFIDLPVEYGIWVLSLLMLGAVLMHIKVKDSFKKASPSLLLLILLIIWICLN